MTKRVFSEPTRIDFIHLDPAKYTVAVLHLPKAASMEEVHHLMDALRTLPDALDIDRVILVPEDAELTFEQFDGPVVPLINGEPVTK